MSKTFEGTEPARAAAPMGGAPRWSFRDARELFEAAAEASREAHLIALQRERMGEEPDLSAAPLGPRVSGGAAGSGTERRALSRAAREEALDRREAEAYELIDLADAVLWGRDWETGLSALVPGWWCDVLWHHYLGRRKWEAVGALLGYSPQRCKQVRDLALDTVDAWGIVGTMEARALNDPDTWAADARRRRWRDFASRG